MSHQFPVYTRPDGTKVTRNRFGQLCIVEHPVGPGLIGVTSPDGRIASLEARIAYLEGVVDELRRVVVSLTSDLKEVEASITYHVDYDELLAHVVSRFVAIAEAKGVTVPERYDQAIVMRKKEMLLAGIRYLVAAAKSTEDARKILDAYFNLVEKSRFLWENDKNFRPGLDWLLSIEKIDMIKSGKYLNCRAQKTDRVVLHRNGAQEAKEVAPDARDAAIIKKAKLLQKMGDKRSLEAIVAELKSAKK